MTLQAPLSLASMAVLLLAGAALCASHDASAMALIGGVISLSMVPGFGLCTASAPVSTSTPQAGDIRAVDAGLALPGSAARPCAAPRNGQVARLLSGVRLV